MADETDKENSWYFAYVGSGHSKKDEYLIINRATGMFLTCSGDYAHN